MTFPQKYKNLEFLSPLANSMTQKEPASRPLASEALKQFEGITGKLPIHVVKWKLKNVKSHRIVHLYRNFTSLGPVCIAYVKCLLRMFIFTLSKKHRGLICVHRVIVDSTISCPTSCSFSDETLARMNYLCRPVIRCLPATTAVLDVSLVHCTDEPDSISQPCSEI